MTEATVADAIEDLIRVTIAINSEGNKPEMVRRLNAAGIRPARIAAILGMQGTSVNSLIAKSKKTSVQIKGL